MAYEHDWHVFGDDSVYPTRVSATSPTLAKNHTKERGVAGQLWPHFPNCDCESVTQPCETWLLTKKLTGTRLGRLCGL